MILRVLGSWGAVEVYSLGITMVKKNILEIMIM
jgi:hypothetical protein